MKKDSFHDWEKIKVSIDELMFANELRHHVINGRVPDTKNPADLGFIVDEEDGNLTQYRFVDRPSTRADIAIMEAFKDDKPRATAISMRLWLFYKVMFTWGKELNAYVRQKEDGSQDVHECVIRAVLECPLYKKSRVGFDKRRFFFFVKKFKQEEKDEEVGS